MNMEHNFLNHQSKLVCVMASYIALSTVPHVSNAASKKPEVQKMCKNRSKPFAYTVCSFKNQKSKQTDTSSKLKLHWWDKSNKQPFHNFANLKKYFAQNGKTLRFAMNAGMYDQNFAPLALYVENGKKYKTLSQKQGGGNFHLLPNGVFWIDKDGASHVTETRQYAKAETKAAHKPTYATQSGPMLVTDGKLHPKFKKNSHSRKMRNGVGICKGNNGKETVNFVISDTWVNFYDFASLFKDKLNCKNALFLDGGRASALFSDDISRHDKKYMGVIISYAE